VAREAKYARAAGGHRRWSHSSVRRRLRVAIVAALAAVFAGFTAMVTTAPANALNNFDPKFPRLAVLKYTDCDPTCDSPGAEKFGTLGAPQGLFVDSPRRVLYAFNGKGTLMPRGVATVDIDRLEQTSWIDLNRPDGLGNDLFVKGLAFDQPGRRLFLGEATFALGCPGAAAGSAGAKCASPGRFAVVDLTKKAPVPTFVPLPTANLASDVPESHAADGVAGLSYDEARKQLYVVTASSEGVDGGMTDLKGVSILAYDARNLTSSSLPLWSYRVRPCRKLVNQKSGGAYIDVAADGSFAYIACQGNAYAPSGVAIVNLDGASTGSTAKFTTEFHPLAGNLNNGSMIGDPANDRVGFAVSGIGRQRLYIFDAAHRSWVASMLLGDANIGGGGAHPVTGRFYALNHKDGLKFADAAALPAILGKPVSLDHNINTAVDVKVDPITNRVFLPGPNYDVYPAAHLWVLEDRYPQYTPVPPKNPDKDTHDIDEDDAAEVSHTGTGSAYGARIGTAGGYGPADGAEDAFVGPLQDFKPPKGNRGLYLGRVAKTQLTGGRESGSGTASAGGIVLDDGTAAYLKSTYGIVLARLGSGGDQLSYESLTGNVEQLSESSCSDLGGEPDVDQRKGSMVQCRSLDTATAWASATADAKPKDEGGVTWSVGYSDADVKVVKDTKGGVFTTSKAVARDIEVRVPDLGTLSIGEITSVAAAYAKGRVGTPTEPGADSELVSTAKNVRIVDKSGAELFTCGVPGVDDSGQCDTGAITKALNELWAPRVVARGPRIDMDPLTTGSPRGAQAIVWKDPYAFWSDLNVEGDARQEAAGLTLVFYNDDTRASRLKIELAGVYAETVYQIGERRFVENVGPTRLKIDLADEAGKPLAGGVFQVSAAAGDPLLAEALKSCVTDSDGIGDCTFDGLEPGDYVVAQKVAPAGYAPADPANVTLEGDYESSVSFTNLKAIGRIALSLSDDGSDGGTKPLPGATFTVLSDDGDLVRGAADTEYGACTTDESGACAFEDVPLGNYVVTQTATPEGYLTADDVGFALERPGQAAELAFVTGLVPIEAVAGSEPVAETARVDEPTDTSEVVVVDPPLQSIAQVSNRPIRNGGGGSLPRRLLAVPTEIARFLLRKPAQALLFGSMWLLFGAPVYLGARRRNLLLAKEMA